MKSDLTISICCITYNQEKYIAKTIEGFLIQKLDCKYEIIIHDDASTDQTAEIVRKYEKRYPNLIRGIYQKENQYSKGISTGQIVRNEAKGKYIAMCEGDDYWIDPNKLEQQIEFLEKNQEYIATAHWCRVIDQNDNESNSFKNSDKIFNFKNKEYLLEDYKKEYIPGHVNSIVHRNIFKNKSCNYDEIYKASKLVGDRTTYLILALSGKIYVHHKVMSVYRYITNDGISYSSRVNKKNRHGEWVQYYSNLEKYVYLNMGKKINLKRLKYQHFILAITEYLRNRSLENKNVIKKIWAISNKIECIIYFPKAILNRLELYFRYKS